jgi:hypothetical protein
MASRSKFVLGLLATGSLVTAGPCDLYSTGGTPCVAAHSTTRALYSAYSGALYQVKRGSDNSTTTVYPLSAGGVANAATQDTFCASTTCLISIIYDQSGRNNHLTQAPPGGASSGPEANGYDNLASAIGGTVRRLVVSIVEFRSCSFPASFPWHQDSTGHMLMTVFSSCNSQWPEGVRCLHLSWNWL